MLRSFLEAKEHVTLDDKTGPELWSFSLRFQDVYVAGWALKHNSTLHSLIGWLLYTKQLRSNTVIRFYHAIISFYR